MMLEIEGPKGSGKSYGATAVALFVRTYGRSKGLEAVAANFDIKDAGIEVDLPFLRVYSLQDLDDEWRVANGLAPLRKTLVIYDEAHKEIGARDWENLSGAIKNTFAESRKDENHLILITQVWKNLDVWARRLADEVWSASKFICWTFWWKAEVFDPEKGEVSGWSDLRVFRRPWHDLEPLHPFGGLLAMWELSGQVAGAYDSQHKIEVRNRKREKKSPDARAGTPAGPPPRSRAQDELPFE